MFKQSDCLIIEDGSETSVNNYQSTLRDITEFLRHGKLMQIFSVQLYNCTTVQLYKCTTLQLYNCTTVQLYNFTTVQLYNCANVQLYNCATVQLYNCAIVQTFNTFSNFPPQCMLPTAAAHCRVWIIFPHLRFHLTYPRKHSASVVGRSALDVREERDSLTTAIQTLKFTVKSLTGVMYVG
jgi:hypothetical protein